MKAEHRKELQTNALAEGMGRMIRGIRQKPKGRSVLIWVVVLAVAAGVIFWVWRSGNTRQKSSEQWSNLDIGTSPDHLLVVGFRPPDYKEVVATRQGEAARFQVAWFMLYESGIRSLADRGNGNPFALLQGKDSLLQAKTLYSDLTKEVGEDPIWGPEALYNFAVAEECLAVDPSVTVLQLDAAATAFGEVTKKFPESARGKDAAKRADALKKDSPQRTEIERYYSQYAPFYKLQNDLYQQRQLQTEKHMQEMKTKAPK